MVDTKPETDKKNKPSVIKRGRPKLNTLFCDKNNKKTRLKGHTSNTYPNTNYEIYKEVDGSITVLDKDVKYTIPSKVISMILDIELNEIKHNIINRLKLMSQNSFNEWMVKHVTIV